MLLQFASDEAEKKLISTAARTVNQNMLKNHYSVIGSHAVMLNESQKQKLGTGT